MGFKIMKYNNDDEEYDNIHEEIHNNFNDNLFLCKNT